MANKIKTDQGRRVNLQLPTAAFQLTERLAARRKQSISEFIRRSIDFQDWLENNIPHVKGFGADELAKITLAHEQLADLERQRTTLVKEEVQHRRKKSQPVAASSTEDCPSEENQSTLPGEVLVTQASRRRKSTSGSQPLNRSLQPH